MLYAGFYSLRYNAQEFFGSKFGRENTPEKRLKDDISDISDNISFIAKQTKNETIQVSDNDANNEFEDSKSHYLISCLIHNSVWKKTWKYKITPQ